MTCYMVTSLIGSILFWWNHREFPLLFYGVGLLVLAAAFGLSRNQGNLDFLMARRGHDFASLPARIRYYNIRLLAVLLVILCAAAIFIRPHYLRLSCSAGNRQEPAGRFDRTVALYIFLFGRRERSATTSVYSHSHSDSGRYQLGRMADSHLSDCPRCRSGTAVQSEKNSAGSAPCFPEFAGTSGCPVQPRTVWRPI